MGHGPHRLQQLEAGLAAGQDVQTALLQALDLRNASRCPHRMRFGGFSNLVAVPDQQHPERFIPVDTVADHGLVPLLENVERQGHAGEQHHIVQGEQRQLVVGSRREIVRIDRHDAAV